MSWARGTSGLAVGRIVAAVLSAGWLAAAARLLPRPEFGGLALLLGIGAVTSVVADGGYTLTTTKLVAATGSLPERLLVQVLTRRIPLALVATGLTVAVFAVLGEEWGLAPALLSGVSLVATAGYTTITAALRGIGRPGPEAMNEIGSRALMIVVGVFVLRQRPAILSAVAVYAAADTLSLVALSIVIQRYPRTATRQRDQDLSLRRVLPVGIAGVLGNLFNRVDIWLLAAFRDPAAVALYGAAYRLYEAALIPASAQAALTLYSARSRRVGVASPRQGPLWAAAIGAVIATVVAATSPQVVRLVFGSAYADSAPLLRLLALAIPFSAAAYVAAPLVAAWSGLTFLRVVTVALVAVIALDVIVIPRYGGRGAAAVTVLGSALLSAGLVWFSRRHDETYELSDA